MSTTEGPVLRGPLARAAADAFLRAPRRQDETAAAYRRRLDGYRAQLRRQPPERLLAKLFSNWRNGALTEARGQLASAGLHDLYSTAQAGVMEHVDRVLALNPPPRDQLETAILLYRSICQTDRLIVIDNGRGKETISALRPEQGGIDVRYREDLINLTPLVPAAILGTPDGRRFGVCHEHGALFISLLRAAGINGQIKCCDGHTSVLVRYQGKNYQFDLTSGSPRITLVPAGRMGAPDRRGIAGYYTYLAGKTVYPELQPEQTPEQRSTRLAEGLKLAELATELYPTDTNNWSTRAQILLQLGRYSEARETAQAALRVNEDNAVAQDIIITTDQQGNVWDKLRYAVTSFFRRIF